MQKFIPIPIILIILIAVAISGCDPFKGDQIRAEAEAEMTTTEAEILELNNALERKQSEDQHNIDMLHEQLEYDRRVAVEADVISGWRMFIQAFFLVATAVAVFALLFVGRNTVREINRVQTGFATALIQAADIRSRLIYLDDKGQFPALLQYVSHGRYTLTDLNAKVTMELDTRNDGDSQMIAGMIAVRHTGVIAREARKTGDKNADAYSLMQNPPIIIDVKTIARDLASQKDGTHEQ